MTPKQTDMLKFTAVMFVVLLGVTVAFVVVLDIRLPWEAPPAPPSEPKEFDLGSLKTMVRQFEPGRGMVAVQNLASVDPAGRCAVVAESMEEPTMAGYHYVFNALEVPRGVVTAYPVETAQYEALVGDCRSAGRAADGIGTSAQDIASELRLAQLEIEKEQAAEERARRDAERKDDDGGGIGDVFEKVKDGELGGVEGLLGNFKK